jgi:protocatechuate 3,4-dioxygenase, alpha subunit
MSLRRQYRFETIEPGRVPCKDSRPLAPHITFWIVARGALPA